MRRSGVVSGQRTSATRKLSHNDRPGEQEATAEGLRTAAAVAPALHGAGGRSYARTQVYAPVRQAGRSSSSPVPSAADLVDVDRSPRPPDSVPTGLGEALAVTGWPKKPAPALPCRHGFLDVQQLPPGSLTDRSSDALWISGPISSIVRQPAPG